MSNGAEPALVPEYEPRGRTEADVLAWLDQWEDYMLRRAVLYSKNAAMSPALGNLTDAYALLPRVREACRGAAPDLLDLLVSAVVMGRLVGDALTWGYAWWEEQNQPDTRRGRVVREGAAKGGKEPKPGVADRQKLAVTLYEERQRRGPRRSRSDISREICKQVGRSARQVDRYLAAAGVNGAGKRCAIPAT